MTSAISGLSMSAERFRRERDEAREIARKLLARGMHTPRCRARDKPPGPCTCGLYPLNVQVQHWSS